MGRHRRVPGTELELAGSDAQDRLALVQAAVVIERRADRKSLSVRIVLGCLHHIIRTIDGE